jgi:signal transduction histidine kinase/DNA-binding NarL/FixJ family response regulator/HPt (histidine-containing phosphotransfer) domain-containing protein
MRVLLLLALAMQILLWPAHAQVRSGPTVLAQANSVDLLPAARLFKDDGGPFPASPGALAAWTASLTPAARIDPMGGAYWLVTSVRNDTPVKEWALDPNNTLINRIEAHLFDADGGVQQVHTGFQASREYFLHYGKNVRLEPQHEYQLVMRFSSPYFIRVPVVSLLPQAEFSALVIRENFLITASLGALVALAIVNSFIFSFTRNRATLYYTLYLVTYVIAWAMAFNVLTDLFDWRHVELHFVPFFLLPVFSTLFYLNFLPLERLAPRLASISRVNLVLPLLMLPSCFLALGWAHKLVTLVITLWLVLALICGIVAWKRGFQPARYFVFGFIAVMVPALLVVPANLGLMGALKGNAQVLTLLGGTLDALLLAFALADQIRILRDKMERNVDRRTQELLHANEALTIAKEHAEVVSRHRIDFLSAMSHDIRTPLAGVIGMLKLSLRDTAVRGRTEEYLRIGLRNGESLLSILNDILDFSKIDAGKLTLETTSFPLASLIADAAGILQGQADAKGLALRVELAPGLPQFVDGDPTRIRQILVNLLGNAIKFTEQGEVLLAVGAGAAGDGVTPVSFAVSDTGPGIPRDVQARLFQKFEQADHSTTRRYGGTGLGLAICKELVGLMGGEISVDSTVGAGSRFVFTLPLAAAGAPLAPHEARPRARHSHRLHILCAEDVRTNQIIIGALLEAMGHQVHMVENGLEVLAALAGADFDMVLMDGRMPLMDGEQATRTIRAAVPGAGQVRNPRIPIVALTANASAPDCARYLAAGMDGFLSKPVDEARLYDVIQATIDGLLAAGRALRRAGAAPARDDSALARQFGVAEDAGEALRIAPLPGLTSAHMERIVQAFVLEAPRRLAQARSAIDAGNAAAAADALHALKGSSGYLSSPRVHQLAGALEALANAGLLDQAQSGFGQLELALGDALASTGQAGAIL